MKVDAVTSRRRADAYQGLRGELLAYVTRLVAREDVAEEIVQEAALRLLEAEGAPEGEALRPWLFRVATHLAIDHLRRHSTWRETVLVDARERAEADLPFVAESGLLRGSPEMKGIAKEHLVVCFACTLRSAGREHAAALLLAEVYGFTVAEVADLLGARPAQVKNWIQSARARLAERYASTCALVTRGGVCHQCVELDGFFEAGRGDPLAGTARDVSARLAILRERRDAPLGPWHRRMMRLVEEVLSSG